MAGTVGQLDGRACHEATTGLAAHERDALERLTSWLEPDTPKACPRCADTRLCRWGKSGRGRPRHRCRGCRRTFSAATGTALLRLRDPGKLRKLLAEMVDGTTRSCRALATELGWSKNTVWRWRATIMAALDVVDEPASEPILQADLHIIRESRKASREWVRHAADPSGSPAPDRPRWIDVDSGRLPEALPRERFRVPLLVTLDAEPGWRAQQLTAQPCSGSLDARGAAAGRSPAASFSDVTPAPSQRHATKALLRRPNNADLGHSSPRLGSPGELLRRFLEPFRGPATRHLRGYLAWFGASRPAPPAHRMERAWAVLLADRSTCFGGMRPAPH